MFNDGAFDDVTRQQVRDEMLIDLVTASRSASAPTATRVCVMGTDGQLRIVEVADVGEDAILVHDAHRDDPGLAFALARLSHDDHSPTPFGVFRAVERPDYGMAVGRQLAEASSKQGPRRPRHPAAQQRHLGRRLTLARRFRHSHGAASPRPCTVAWARYCHRRHTSRPDSVGRDSRHGAAHRARTRRLVGGAGDSVRIWGTFAA